MAKTVTITSTIQGAGDSLSATETYSDEAIEDLDITILDAVSDQEVVVDWVNTRLAVLVISSDQEITVESNDGTTPDDTATVKANAPLIFKRDGSAQTNPFASLDVAKLFLTNASGSTATVKIKVLKDVTP